MKKYYQTLNSNAKKEIKEQYKKEYHHSELETRFTRLNIYIVLALISALVLIILSYQYEKNHIYSIIIAIILVMAALTFLIGKYFIKLNILNKIALKSQKK